MIGRGDMRKDGNGEYGPATERERPDEGWRRHLHERHFWPRWVLTMNGRKARRYHERDYPWCDLSPLHWLDRVNLDHMIEDARRGMRCSWELVPATPFRWIDAAGRPTPFTQGDSSPPRDDTRKPSKSDVSGRRGSGD